MANAEWDELKQALRKPATPEAMKAASEAFKKYRVVKLGKGSRPTLVSLGKGKTYPNAIPLEQIPEEIERNPEFYNLMKRIVTKET